MFFKHFHFFTIALCATLYGCQHVVTCKHNNKEVNEYARFQNTDFWFEVKESENKLIITLKNISSNDMFLQVFNGKTGYNLQYESTTNQNESVGHLFWDDINPLFVEFIVLPPTYNPGKELIYGTYYWFQIEKPENFIKLNSLTLFINATPMSNLYSVKNRITFMSIFDCYILEYTKEVSY